MADIFPEWIGTTQTIDDTVSQAVALRFKATIDSPSPADCVPQGLHWCLCLPDTPTAALGEDGHPVKGLFLPPIERPRRMSAASAVEFLAPLKVGDAIRRVSKITAITNKEGESGKLTFVEVEHTILAAGAVCIIERQTIVFRGAAMQPAPLPPTGDPDLTAWPWRRSITPSSVLLLRYSALTFNSHRIHYDLPYATCRELYPGLVVHGPLMATLLLDLCARELGPNAVRNFTFRIVAPAFADQELHLVGRPDDGTIALRALGADGRTIVSAKATIRNG